MNRKTIWGTAAGALALAGIVIVPGMVGAAVGDGYDAYIQSGTCAAPTEDVHVNLKSEGDHDVRPYEAELQGGDETTVLGYYGAPSIPGFGLAAIYTDQQFSLVIADTTNGEPVACGDILEPDADRFRDVGAAVVQLLPVAGGTVQGIAEIQRAPLQREDDVTPTRARIILSTDAASVTTPTTPADGFDGYVQGGFCDAPTELMRVPLRSTEEHDVRPYHANTDDGTVVTVAYFGAPTAPGFGLAAAYTEQRFSLVIADTDTAEPLACGNILQPVDDDFTDAGVALVQLTPVGDSGVSGFATVQRTTMQRELDIAPTRVRVAIFAPPITST